jgi:hypothetical protein
MTPIDSDAARARPPGTRWKHGVLLPLAGVIGAVAFFVATLALVAMQLEAREAHRPSPGGDASAAPGATTLARAAAAPAPAP